LFKTVIKLQATHISIVVLPIKSFVTSSDSPSSIDTKTNRLVRKYSWREQLLRIAWTVGALFIRLSPRPAFTWRRMVLRLFGATIGKRVNIYPSTKIYMPWNIEIGDWTALGEDVFVYSLGTVRIGKNVTISYRSHLCAGTHDLRDPLLPLLKPPIVIEDDVWVGTDAFIGPGITIGHLAVIGARAVVVKHVDAESIVAGNPARVIGHRSLTSTAEANIDTASDT
jgi:putative colanic acid biosynthesis acetyltransferase WcaF